VKWEFLIIRCIPTAYPQHAAAADLKRFPKIELVKINQQFGGWPAAQKKFFADGGIFDDIQKK
jgi:ABC-type sulfate transport system substrate-binding protein